MRLPRLLAARSGFTFIEVLIVVAILAVVFAMGLPVGWDFYLGYQIEVERDNLVTLLRDARTSAFSNRNESNHGLYFDNNNFIVFEGSSFATRNTAQDRIIPRFPNVSISGQSEIVFTTLSGETTSSTYTLTSGQKVRTVNVNTEGLVDW